jgi:hypothetical protein
MLKKEEEEENIYDSSVGSTIFTAAKSPAGWQ